MIRRFTSEQLRKLADQLDGYNQIHDADGHFFNCTHDMTIDGEKHARLFWWEDGRQYLCEILDFEPGVPKASP